MNLPLLPRFKLVVPHECLRDHENDKTDHEVQFVRHDLINHEVTVQIVCRECVDRAVLIGGKVRMKKITFTFKEWVSFLASFTWNFAHDEN